MEDLEFIPLEIRKSHFLDGVTQIYRVVTKSGEVTDVEASSAHEAMEKSGIKNPLKIISGISEKNRMLQKSVLVPEGYSVPTDINIDNNVSDMSFLMLDELDESPKAPFEAASLKDLYPAKPVLAPAVNGVNGTNGHHDHPSDMSAEEAGPEAVNVPVAAQQPTQEFDEPLELPPELKALQDKELSEDEIAKLLGE